VKFLPSAGKPPRRPCLWRTRPRSKAVSDAPGANADFARGAPPGHERKPHPERTNAVMPCATATGNIGAIRQTSTSRAAGGYPRVHKIGFDCIGQPNTVRRHQARKAKPHYLRIPIHRRHHLSTFGRQRLRCSATTRRPDTRLHGTSAHARSSAAAVPFRKPATSCPRSHHRL
jgi:hypothetical protein